MEFSNLFFIYLFFPLCTVIYFVAPEIKWKNVVLTLFSLLFYCFSRPVYIPLLVGLAFLNYCISKYMYRDGLYILVSLLLNVGVLVFFKLGIKIPLPMGISFYTFSLIAYQIDAYREESAECDSFGNFLLFVAFFPKMIMGPIWRYSEAARQIKSRATEPVDIFYGCRRFVLGLSKKVLLADPLFRIYEQMETHGSWLSQWVGAFAFMLYIYMEFSGYADMACGMGRIFGFRLPENFKEPYTAISVSEFWRRWHCSLGMFFRDYIYIPLGGNRKGLPRQICNLLVVWILTGLWHGISWTFFLWGMYFFFLLTVEKLTGVLRSHRYVFIRRCLTLLLICFGWIIFSAPDLPTFGERVVKLFSFTTGGLRPTLVVLQSSLPLLILSAILAIPGPVWNKQMDKKLRKSSLHTRKTVVVLQGVLILCLLVLCTVSLIGATARPSMYAGF